MAVIPTTGKKEFAGRRGAKPRLLAILSVGFFTNPYGEEGGRAMRCRSARDHDARRCVYRRSKQIERLSALRWSEIGDRQMPSMTALVVDDDAVFVVALAAMLQGLGLRAAIARSGAEALHLLYEGINIDFVLSDVSMPRMTELELARILSEKRPDLPVILMTGRPSALDSSVPAHGATLLKPFSAHALLLALEPVVSTANLNRGSEALQSRVADQ